MKQFKRKMTATVMSAAVMMSIVTTNLSADGSIPASVTTPPAPIEGIRDDGSYHDLVHPGVANGGYMVYSLYMIASIFASKKTGIIYICN